MYSESFDLGGRRTYNFANCCQDLYKKAATLGLLGDKANSDIGLSYRPASHVAWRAGTTTLCRSWLYPPLGIYEFGRLLFYWFASFLCWFLLEETMQNSCGSCVVSPCLILNGFSFRLFCLSVVISVSPPPVPPELGQRFYTGIMSKPFSSTFGSPSCGWSIYSIIEAGYSHWSSNLREWVGHVGLFL